MTVDAVMPVSYTHLASCRCTGPQVPPAAFAFACFRKALITDTEGCAKRKQAAAVLAFLDILLFVFRQIAHDRFFGFFPFPVQPFQINVLAQADGELIVQIQHLIEGFIPGKA